MAYTNFFTNARRGMPLGTNTNTNTLRGDALLSRVHRRVQAAASGSGKGVIEGWTLINNETANAVCHRAGAFVISATTGSATVVVNDTSVTADFDTSLGKTGDNTIAAINADATANTFVSAHNRVAKLTTASAIAGDTVNVFGVTFTAVSAAVTAGSNLWDIRTSDTAAGLSLATQINAHPLLANLCGAVNVAGVVYVYLLENRYGRPSEVISSTGGTVTINNQLVKAQSYTLTTVSAIAGNKVRVGPVEFVAQGSAATAGTAQWDIRTGDNQSATSLAVQINAHASLQGLVTATASTNIVTVQYVYPGAIVAPVQTSGATVTIAAVSETLLGVAIVAHTPGVIGNCCTLTVTGTNAAARSLVSGKLGGGLGCDALSQIIESTQR